MFSLQFAEKRQQTFGKIWTNERCFASLAKKKGFVTLYVTKPYSSPGRTRTFDLRINRLRKKRRKSRRLPSQTLCFQRFSPKRIYFASLQFNEIHTSQYGNYSGISRFMAGTWKTRPATCSSRRGPPRIPTPSSLPLHGPPFLRF